MNRTTPLLLALLGAAATACDSGASSDVPDAGSATTPDAGPLVAPARPSLGETILEESGYTEMWQADRSADAPGRLEAVLQSPGYRQADRDVDHEPLAVLAGRQPHRVAGAGPVEGGGDGLSRGHREDLGAGRCPPVKSERGQTHRGRERGRLRLVGPHGQRAIPHQARP